MPTGHWMFPAIQEHRAEFRFFRLSWQRAPTSNNIIAVLSKKIKDGFVSAAIIKRIPNIIESTAASHYAYRRYFHHGGSSNTVNDDNIVITRIIIIITNQRTNDAAFSVRKANTHTHLFTSCLLGGPIDDYPHFALL